MLSNSEFGFSIKSIDVQKAAFFNIDGSDRRTVLVYVESREDKRFWGACFPKIEGVRFEFKIADEVDASDGKKANGCTRLLALKNLGDLVLGPNLVLCLDSDERFLSALYWSRVGAHEAHIYYTNVYSIESVYLHGSHADSTFEAVAACSVTDLACCPSELLAHVSSAVYKTVLLLAFSLESYDYASIALIKEEFKISVTSLGALNPDAPINESQVFHDFTCVMAKINRELLHNIYDRGLELLYAKFLESVALELIDESNAYLFVRGHDLYPSIVNVFECANRKRHRAEVGRVSKIYKGAKDAVKAVHNEFTEFDGALRYGFYAAKPSVPFFERTVTRIVADYTK